MLGNTPRSYTLFRLDRAKSFAFEVRFVDEDGVAADMTGAVVRMVVEQPDYLGGAEVINATADMTNAEGGRALFALQATDTDLDPETYALDITVVADSGYSVPIVKGGVEIVFNVDDDTSNVYSGPNLTSGIEVVLSGTDIIQVRLDGYVQNAINQADLDLAVAGLASEAYVDASVLGLASEAYVDAADATKLEATDLIAGSNINISTAGNQVTINSTAGGTVGEAPINGQPHARQDAGWVEIATPVIDHGALNGLEDEDDHPWALREVWGNVEPPGQPNKRWIDPDASFASLGQHADLQSLDAPDSHPISAITDLQFELDGKSDTGHSHPTLNAARGFAWQFDSVVRSDASFPWHIYDAYTLQGQVHADLAEALAYDTIANVQYYDGADWQDVSGGVTLPAGQTSASAPVLDSSVPAGLLRAVIVDGGASSFPAVRGTSTSNSGAGASTTTTLAIPGGTVDGDLLIAVLAINNNQGTGPLNTPPDGWTHQSTLVTDDATSTYRVTQYIYTATYQTGVTGTGWTFNASGVNASVVVAVNSAAFQHAGGSKFAATGNTDGVSVLTGTTSAYSGLGFGIWSGWSSSTTVLGTSPSVTGKTLTGGVLSKTARVGASNEFVYVGWWTQNVGESTGATYTADASGGPFAYAFANYGMVLEAGRAAIPAELVVQVEGKTA